MFCFLLKLVKDNSVLRLSFDRRCFKWASVFSIIKGATLRLISGIHLLIFSTILWLIKFSWSSEKNKHLFSTILIISRNNLTDNKANDDEKVNLIYLKFKTCISVTYKINKYLKSVFTLNAFQDFFCSVKFL